MHFKICGLVQERRNSIADALELHLPYTNPHRNVVQNSSHFVSGFNVLTHLSPDKDGGNFAKMTWHGNCGKIIIICFKLSNS